MGFLISILEEKNSDLNLQNYIIESLSVDRTISSISASMKKYFINNTRENTKYKHYHYKRAKTLINNEKKVVRLKLHSKYKFDREIYHYFLNAYFEDNEYFPESV